MIKCKICDKEFNSINGLSKHIVFSHKEITKEMYYKMYIDNTAGVCYCGNSTTFRGLGRGFLEFCSSACYSNSEKFWSLIKGLNKGRKQSSDTISKRIANTDQVKKESNRQKTAIEKYGVMNTSQLEHVRKKISEGNKNRVSPRSPEHQAKIIDSKRNNGTLKHSQETKNKIRKSLKLLYSSDNPPVTVSTSSNGRHKTGWINGMFYRSSYEKTFLEYCFANGIEVISAENSEFRVRYIDDNGNQRWYYPDFFLPKFGCIVEIKPISMLDIRSNLRKIDAIMRVWPTYLVTEEELCDLDTLFKYMEI